MKEKKKVKNIKRKDKKRIKSKRKRKSWLVKHLLIFTSFIFLTNVLSAGICQHYLYSFLFALLTLTSVVYHWTRNIYTNILDKIGIFLVVFYGTYNLHKKTHAYKFVFVTLVVFLFLVTNMLYIYGYFTKQFCFHRKLCIGNKYHSLVHCISSLAHHLIIFM
jgi:hypothetical protein